MPRKWMIYDRVPGAEIGFRAIVEADGSTVCSPSPMGDSNARLIAAAPDLLACLEECIFQMEQMQGMFDDKDGTIHAAIDNAKDAIARATGYMT